MILALVPHWTGIDTAAMAAEAIAAFILTVLVGSWLRERVLRWWHRKPVPATAPAQRRDTEPYDDSPAWTAGAALTREE